MRIYNSTTKRKEEFIPQDKNNVKIYACGITTSGDAHIGHAKQALHFDVIRRYFQYKGYNVTYVRNYTDVDDKIIINAKKEGIPAIEYAEKYIGRISEDLNSLGIRSADFEPKASETITEIIEFIQDLIQKGFAYKSEENGDIYFDVSKFKEYGKLSNRSLDNALEGSRKKSTLEGKDDTSDFVLWKLAKPGEPFWESPLGQGRPGWHIECSTMIYKLLGETIDIHGGGMDLKFPHHENEIAQSEARFGKPLAKYWMHCGLVKVNNVKMSKSLGNGLSIRDALSQYDKDVIKWIILKSNYRSDLNIMSGDFRQAEKHLYEIYKEIRALIVIDKQLKAIGSYETSDLAKEIRKNFEEAMDDDFNTAKAISDLYLVCSKIATLAKTPKEYEKLSEVYDAIKETYSNILSIIESEPVTFVELIRDKYFKFLNIDKKEVDSLMRQRLEYKLEKKYEKADLIKSEILAKGLIISDTKDNSIYDINWESLEQTKKNNDRQ